MLLYLHVKNYALIDDVEVEFTDGLNILTGETGAGKSVLLGSISLALGTKAKSDVIRQGEESAFVELHFAIDNEKQREFLKELDIECEDDVVVISRKITHQRSVGKICNVTVNSSDLRAMADLFLDVYGQHDYQNLLKESKHIDLLDGYCDASIRGLKDAVAASYDAYAEIRRELDGLETDENKRQREMDLLSYQLNEIKAANLKSGEEEELKEYLRLAENGEKIASALGRTSLCLSEDEGALGQLSHAFYELRAVSGVSERIGEIEDSLSQAQDILKSVSREMQDYLESLDFDEQTLKESRERYDEICSLMMKYGKTVEEVWKYYDEKSEEYEKLCDFEQYRDSLAARLKKAEGVLKEDCARLTDLRLRESVEFEEEMAAALKELNFNHADFHVEISRNDHYTANGTDLVKFYISTNQGESLKPLNEVASGGELSRIMLAIKTLSVGDLVHTLIFDEIDAGISGQTAWKVAERLGLLARDLQVICITHLPQIAAMNDSHYEIVKKEENGHTTTNVRVLKEYESIEELTRLLGGAQASEAAKKNAKDLRAQAKEIKKQMRK